MVLSGQETSAGASVKHSRAPAFDWLEGIADPVKLGVVRVLARTRPATVAQIAKCCQASVPTVRRHLAALVAMGIVMEEEAENNGATVGRPAIRYYLPRSVLESARQIFASER